MKSAQALPAPVGEWLMNGNLSDSSGNGNDGTALGGTSYAPDRHGVPNAALSVSAIIGPDNNANVSFGTGLLLPASRSFGRSNERLSGGASESPSESILPPRRTTRIRPISIDRS